MLNCLNKILLIKTVRVECRFITIVKKYKNPVIGEDERLVPDTTPEKVHKLPPQKKKRSNLFEQFFDKSVEGLGINDPRFSSVILKSRSLNEESNNSIVVEGVNMIRDAIHFNGKMTHLYFTKRELLKEIPPTSSSTDTQVYFVTYNNMKKFSNMTTPPGIMAVFERPKPENILIDPFLNDKLPVTLICDNIRDPGNLGTIIRTAAGLNINKVLLSRGCVNLYNDKVLRSSMSSIFLMPTFSDLSWDDIKLALSPNCVVHYADISAGDDQVSFPYFDRNLVTFNGLNSYALVIGGEIDGVSEEARNLSLESHGCKLNIPIRHGLNSLNSGIAAAIILSEFQRKFLTK